MEGFPFVHFETARFSDLDKRAHADPLLSHVWASGVRINQARGRVVHARADLLAHLRAQVQWASDEGRTEADPAWRFQRWRFSER